MMHFCCVPCDRWQTPVVGVMVCPSCCNDWCDGPDSAACRLEVPPLQVVDLVVDIPVVVQRDVISLSVHSCFLAEVGAASLVVDNLFMAGFAVSMHLALCSSSCRHTEARREQQLTYARQVLLVTMHFTLCSLYLSAGTSKSASWLLWNRWTVIK